MIDPTHMMFNSHIGAAIFFGGFLVFVIAISLLGYWEAKTKEEKKDNLAFLAVIGSLFAVSLAIVGYFSLVCHDCCLALHG